MRLQIGDRYRDSHRNLRILAFVEGMVVFKWWSEYRQSWVYEIERPYYFRARQLEGPL